MNLSLEVSNNPRLVSERRDRLVVPIPVWAGRDRHRGGAMPLRRLLKILARPGALLYRARERGEAERAGAVGGRVREERLAVREDRLEVVAARGRVRPGTDLIEDGLQVRAAADGWRWGRCGRGGAGV